MDQTWFIYKLGNFIHLSGYINNTVSVSAWTWVVNFSNIDTQYKPKIIIDFYVNNINFRLHPNGYIQNIEDISEGTYVFELSWEMKSN